MPIDLDRVNPLTEAAIGAAIKVHRALGPGLLESVYLECLVYELQRSGLSVRSNIPLPVHYDDVRINLGFRLDAVVNDYLVLELKSVKKPRTHSHSPSTYISKAVRLSRWSPDQLQCNAADVWSEAPDQPVAGREVPQLIARNANLWCSGRRNVRSGLK
jgi:GxxExxY protein